MYGQDFFKEVLGRSRAPIDDFLTQHSPIRGNDWSRAPTTGNDWSHQGYNIPGLFTPAVLSQATTRNKLNPEYNRQTGQTLSNPVYSVSPAGLPPQGKAIVDLATQRFGANAAPVVAAILKAEGGLTGAVGDQNISRVGAHGPFQFYGPGGQLDAYANSLGVDLQTAGEIARSNPQGAAQWAFDNYFGQALQAGIAQGHTGIDLLRDVLAVQNPGALNSAAHFGRYLNALNEHAVDSPTIQDAPHVAPRGVNQYNLGLPKDVADAFCGPSAALAFAQATGRNPTVMEAMNLAKERGWNQAQGMAGPASQVSLLNALGVPSYMAAPDPSRIMQEVQAGRPVIIDTPGHYFQITGYNPATRTFVFGDAVGQRAGNVGQTIDGIANFGFGAARTAIFMRPQ